VNDFDSFTFDIYKPRKHFYQKHIDVAKRGISISYDRFWLIRVPHLLVSWTFWPKLY